MFITIVDYGIILHVSVTTSVNFVDTTQSNTDMDSVVHANKCILKTIPIHLQILNEKDQSSNCESTFLTNHRR